MKPLSKNRKATVMLTHWMSTGPDRSSYLSRLLMGEFVNKFPPKQYPRRPPMSSTLPAVSPQRGRGRGRPPSRTALDSTSSILSDSQTGMMWDAGRLKEVDKVRALQSGTRRCCTPASGVTSA